MVVHGEICGSGCAERIPAHWCVRFGSSFWEKGEGIKQEEKGTIWSGWKGLGAAEEGGGRRRSRVVGKWEVKRGGTTSLCILWMRGGSGGEGGN